MVDEPNNLAEDAVVTDPSEAMGASAEVVSTSSDDATSDDSVATESPALESTAIETADESSGDESSGVAASEVIETAEPSQDESAPDEAVAEEVVPEEQPAAESDATRGKAIEEVDLDEPIVLDWYILKVQSNREKSISEALERRVKIAGLDEYFEQVVVPTEKVTEFKGGRKRVVNRKLYPGYILVRMHINDDTWFLVRETPGIGDFTGSGGKPTPMLPQEVQRIVATEEEKADEAPKLKISFNVGDRVKITEGTFESFEGEVSTVDQTSGHITVMINIFGRSTPVELEYWQAESV